MDHNNAESIILTVVLNLEELARYNYRSALVHPLIVVTTEEDDRLCPRLQTSRNNIPLKMMMERILMRNEP